MPCTKDFKVDTSKPVLVTGATGYVAGVLIQHLLNKGLTVHATVRDPSKKDRLQYLQNIADTSEGTIKFFKADLVEKGSFDDAAKGCNVIFHIASPFNLNPKDPLKELVEPAVQGTENILTTANNTPTVKRVVLTSTCLTLYGHAADASSVPNGVFTEEVWNRTSTLDDQPYSLSKTLAEQKAWVMAGSQTQWELVTVLPSFVMGPGLKYHESSESYQFLVKQVAGGAMKSGAPQIPFGVVDVRDVAAAHVAAAYIPEAQGRNICSGTNTDVVGMGKALAEKYDKAPVPTSVLPMPKTMIWLLGPYIGLNRSFITGNVGYSVTLDNSKSTTQLGMDYLPLTTTMGDMYQQMLDLGVLKEPSS